MKWEDIEEGAFIPANQIEKSSNYIDLGLLTLKESDSFKKKDGLYFHLWDKKRVRGHLLTLNSDSFYKTEKEREGDSPYLYVGVEIDSNEWNRGNIKILKIISSGTGGYWDFPAWSLAKWDGGDGAQDVIYMIQHYEIGDEFLNWINENPLEVKQ